jgi:hypothetical protein
VFTCCWSAKGGSGVTVVAAALALTASRHHAAAIVDLGGDVPATFGLAEPDGPGVAEWSRGSDPSPPAAALVPIVPGLSLLPRGRGPLGALTVASLAALADTVIVDAGCLDRADGPRAGLAARADRSLLVTRACYLALRRAARLALRPDGIVVIVEPQRSLQPSDIAAVVGAPVVAELPLDPAVSRAVDAGLLAARCPSSLLAPLAAR